MADKPAIPPTITDKTTIIPHQNRRLDAIARLITGSEICAAVCYCDE